MRWTVKSADRVGVKAGTMTRSIAAAVAATAMTIAITTPRALRFGAAVAGPPDDDPASKETPAPAHRLPPHKHSARGVESARIATSSRRVVTFLRRRGIADPRAGSRSFGGAMAVPFHIIHPRGGHRRRRGLRPLLLFARPVSEETRG